MFNRLARCLDSFVIFPAMLLISFGAMGIAEVAKETLFGCSEAATLPSAAVPWAERFGARTRAATTTLYHCAFIGFFFLQSTRTSESIGQGSQGVNRDKPRVLHAASESES
jgi:hypothetical protein